MPTDNTTEPTTVGKTCFYQGENNTHPLFRIEPGIPCQDAREQASELMGYVRDLIITGLMDGDQKLIWASHYLSAMAKALLDDAELGMIKVSARKSWKRKISRGFTDCIMSQTHLSEPPRLKLECDILYRHVVHFPNAQQTRAIRCQRSARVLASSRHGQTKRRRWEANIAAGVYTRCVMGNPLRL